MTEADYEEHPSAWLRYGWDEGPMIVLTGYRTGAVTLEKWADQDYEEELEPERRWSVEGAADVLRLWEMLADGRIDQLEAEGGG